MEREIKRAVEKRAVEKEPAEKGPAEKGPAEKGLAEKGLAEKGTAEKRAAEKGPAEKRAAEKGPAEKRTAALKTDWDITHMPFRRKHFKLKRNITEDEMRILRYGNIPQEMEDKWFWYMEGNTLYAHRSWTGNCIFIIEFNENTDIHKVTVNRNKKQYSCKDVNKDREMINTLLNWWVKPDYDYYGEWITETASSLEKTK